MIKFYNKCLNNCKKWGKFNGDGICVNIVDVKFCVLFWFFFVCLI